MRVDYSPVVFCCVAITQRRVGARDHRWPAGNGERSDGRGGVECGCGTDRIVAGRFQEIADRFERLLSLCESSARNLLAACDGTRLHAAEAGWDRDRGGTFADARSAIAGWLDWDGCGSHGRGAANRYDHF